MEATKPVKTFQSRPYQLRIWKKVMENWIRGAKSQIIVSPTGSGKTPIGLKAAKDIIDQIETLRPGTKPEEVGVIWFAHRRELLEQAKRENDQLIGCPNFHAVSIFDAEPERHIAQYKVRVMIVDEGHHAACGSAVNCFLRVNPEFLIGLSATPMRTDKMELGFQIQVQDAGYHRLIQEGWLSKFDHYLFEGAFTPENMARVYLAEPERWGQSVAWFLTRDECEACERLLIAGGVRATTVTGDSDREEQLAAFGRGEYDILLNIQVLTEGWDYPALKTAFVRDSNSAGPTTQMGGRVVRLCPEVGIKQIVQSHSTNYPFTRVAAANSRKVEMNGGWRSIGKSDLVDRMAALMLDRLRNTKAVALPNFLKVGASPKPMAIWNDPESPGKRKTDDS